MTELLIALALALLPMGADVTHTDSGSCYVDTNNIIQVCSDQSDQLTINMGDQSVTVRSEQLTDLVDNI
jgi:hypothetical protein